VKIKVTCLITGLFKDDLSINPSIYTYLSLIDGRGEFDVKN
jgi:hypothetical protein